MNYKRTKANMYKVLNATDAKNIITDAIKKYGQDAQSIVAMEECSELIKEISKLLRTPENKIPNYDPITEEIADVLIMIEELKIIYNIPNENIDVQINYKLNRLKERIKKK